MKEVIGLLFFTLLLAVYTEAAAAAGVAMQQVRSRKADDDLDKQYL